MLQGPFDAAFLDDAFHDTEDQRGTLLSTALLLKPGASPDVHCIAAQAWCESRLPMRAVPGWLSDELG